MAQLIFSRRNVFRYHECYCKCEFPFRNSDSFTETNQSLLITCRSSWGGCVPLRLSPFPLVTLPAGFSFVRHLLSSSLPLSTAALQHKIESPGRPPRCHLPPPFLMRHLSYTKRFQCLIKTIHVLPQASCWKITTVWKPPFLYQLWIFIELRTLINSPWVQAGTSADRVKAFRAEKTALSCSLLLAVFFFTPGALKVSGLAYNIRCGCSEASRRLLRPQLTHTLYRRLLACTPVICLTKWVMSCHFMLCHAAVWSYHIMIHCVAVNENHSLRTLCPEELFYRLSRTW